MPLDAANLSALKLALMAKQLRSDSNSLEVMAAEPIAITGMACRFPGGANDPASFWSLLARGGDAISEVPPDRWDVDEFYDPDPAVPGKMTTRCGGFLDRVDGFDTVFFGISARESIRMDPQQRLALEVAYEALERAGQTRERLSGSQTGVFMASYNDDYALRQTANVVDIEAYTGTGTSQCYISNRLSFLLNLRGPSLTVDTACSSSLVALHLACQSLRQGDSDLALAGGVSLMLSPQAMIAMSKWGMLAPDGRCKTFDARANGFGRGEGCGVLVLKRLADALADGDPVVALIRGSAVNQDGRTNVLTAPNGLAQQAVIRQALSSSVVDAGQVTYLEAHGTGTSLGDPIEVEALSEIFGERAPDRLPCALGSVKANIGHLEAAAGVAGVIKTVLALQHEAIPPHPNFDELNPLISLAATRFAIPTTLQPWPRTGTPRVAGVSAFGAGGTNAHVLLEEAPLRTPRNAAGESTPTTTTHLLPLSAHSPAALRDLATAYAAFLTTDENQGAAQMVDICFTAASRRTQYAQRLTVTGRTRAELAERLRLFGAETRVPGLVVGEEAVDHSPSVAFVFSGQGPQWWGMGRELLAADPVFRSTVERIDALFRTHTTDWSLLTEFGASETTSRLDQTAIAQPAIFALQVGLAMSWRSLGIVPNAVVGHSIGELAAAYMSGSLSLEDAVRVVFHRSRLMQRATGTGKMAQIDLPAAEVERAIAACGDRLSIAAVNGPATTVISGETAALEAALADLADAGVTVRRLAVDYAFHSAQMAPFEAELVRELDGLVCQPGSVPMYSTVTGRRDDGIFDAAYWGRNLRETVRFSTAIDALLDGGTETFVEVGPHPVLTSAITQCVLARGADASVLPSLRRGQPEPQAALTVVGELWVRGARVAWDRVAGATSRERRCVELPTYPWQRERYWFEPTEKRAPHSRATERGTLGHSGGSRATVRHPLLGDQIRSPAVPGLLFENELSAETPAFLHDHRVFDATVLPATAYFEMALAAAERANGPGRSMLEDVVIQQALVLGDTPRTVQVHVAQALDSAEGSSTFRVFSLDDDGDRWILHASGRISAIEQAHTPGAVWTPDDAQARCTEQLSGEAHYERLARIGLDYGPTFRGIERLWRRNDEALGQVRLRTPMAGFVMHPALLDAALQVIGAALESEPKQATYLPIALDTLRVFAQPSGGAIWSHVQLEPGTADTRIAHVGLYEADGRPIAEILGLRVRRASALSIRRQLARQTAGSALDCLYELEWRPIQPADQAAGRATEADRWLVLGDTGGTGAALARALGERGAAVTLALAGDHYGRIDDGSYLLDPGAPTDFQRLLADARADDQRPFRHVVYLWSLNAAPLDARRPPTEGQLAGLGGALHLVQALASSPSTPITCWFITRGAQPVSGTERVAVEQAPIWGFGNSLRLEHPELHSVCVDLDPYAIGGPADEAGLLLRDVLGDGLDGEPRVGLRAGGRFAARLVRVQQPNALRAGAPYDRESVRLESSARGVLDNLSARPVDRRPPGRYEVEVRVQAAGLNFRDVLNALGQYAGEPGPLGDECAGEVVAVGEDVGHLHTGDRVMGMASGSLGTFVTTQADLLTPIPAHLSFADAATIPIAFLTAHLALDRIGHLERGERVLIHAAAGGVGLAAVQLAQLRGAQVFATAGSPAKRAHLRSMGVEQVFDSRSLDFGPQILTATDGHGVDVVLNSLAGEFIPASIGVLAERGRFLELGSTGVWDAERVGHVRPLATYVVVFLGDVSHHQPEVIQSMLRELAPLFADSSLRPLPVRAFPFARAIDAFRYMAQARHIGKIVLGPPLGPADEPDRAIRADATYLITGGLGGIGRQVAVWLVERGARSLALMGRTARPEQPDAWLRELEQVGAQVAVLAGDVADPAALEHVLAELDARGWPPLRGIIHASGINDDGVLLQQDWPRLASVLRPKLDGAWNLHLQTRDRPLDFMIFFSSAAAVLGAAGQATYAAANAALDALAQRRLAEGLPALSIDWGAWEGPGMTEKLGPLDRARWARRGLEALPPDRALAALGEAMRLPQVQLLALAAHWSTLATDSVDAALVSQLVTDASQTERTPGTLDQPSAGAALLERWSKTPAGQRRQLLMTYLHDEAIHVLGLPAGLPIPPRQPLLELGLDSLTAVELRNALCTSLACALPATLLFDYPTSEALATFLMQQVPGLRDVDALADTPAREQVDSPRDAAAEIDGLSDDEVEALLLAELASMSESH